MLFARWLRCATRNKQAPVLPELHSLYVRGNGSADDSEMTTVLALPRYVALWRFIDPEINALCSSVLPLNDQKKKSACGSPGAYRPDAVRVGQARVRLRNGALAARGPADLPRTAHARIGLPRGIELVDLCTVLSWDVKTFDYFRVSDLVLLLKSCMNTSRWVKCLAV